MTPVSPLGKLPCRALLWAWLGVLSFCQGGLPARAEHSGPSPRLDPLPRGYRYRHEEVKDIPWSIHVFEFDRSRSDLSLTTGLGGGRFIGMGTVSDQVKGLPPTLGTPVAAVNGDFYNTEDRYSGDPRDVMIHQGELISAPDGHASFWIDHSGQPHSTNVVSRFQLRWPGGSTTAFGLNEPRDREAAVLYTTVTGASTRTTDGTEYVLEAVPGKAWLPLKVGEPLSARIREIRPGGDAPLGPDRPILSVGPGLAAKQPKLAVGEVVEFISATFPDLTGSRLALGGGPTLVRNSQPMTWTSSTARHPRTAMGWNQDRFYLVEVDGRQAGLSAGMSFPELATFMAKLGCTDALNLDGGGSATFWVHGQVMNSPSEGRERPGATTLVVVQKRSEPAPPRDP